MLSPDIADPEQKFGYLGGILRIHAVATLYEAIPDIKIITSSTVKGISHAQVQERELKTIFDKRDVNIPDGSIIREEKSDSTKTELVELIRLILKNNWQGAIVALTNDYHIERSKEM